MTRFLIFGSSLLCEKVHGKTLCNIYCWSLAKFTEKIGHSTVNSFPIQSFIFIHFVSSGILYAGLTLVVFSSYGRKSRRARLLFDKSNWFRFSSAQLRASERMIQSTNIFLLVTELNW